MTNPLPENTQAAWQWDRAQRTIDLIRKEYPEPSRGEPDPLENLPGVQRRYNEARAVQIVLEGKQAESADKAILDKLDAELRAWTRGNPPPPLPKDEVPA